MLLPYEKDFGDCNGITALMIAAQKNNDELLNIILPYQKGAYDNQGRTALMHAIENDAIDVINVLVQYGEENISDSWTSLSFAVDHGKRYENFKNFPRIIHNLEYILTDKQHL